MAESLIVLSAEDAAAGLAEIRKRGRVVSVLPPRLLIVELDDDRNEAVRRLPTTQALIADPAEPIPVSLSDSERLFVDAWRQRQQRKDKQRIGDGQPWDAEGFLPPDPPKKR